MTTFLVYSFQLLGQSHFGAYVQSTHSTLLLRTPEHPEFGQYSFTFQSGIGAGIIYDVDIAKNITLSHRLNYSQKGFTTRERTDDNRYTNEKIGYTFHYARIDEFFKYWLMKNQENAIYLIGGLRNELLLGHDSLDKLLQPQTGEIIENPDFNQWNFGGVLGAGIRNCNTFLEGGIDMDLAPGLETESTKIRGITWFANIGIII